MAPGILSKVMPDMVAEVEAYIGEMPPDMAELMPGLLPKTMDALMPSYIPQLIPYLVPLFVGYLHDGGDDDDNPPRKSTRRDDGWTTTSGKDAGDPLAPAAMTGTAEARPAV